MSEYNSIRYLYRSKLSSELLLLLHSMSIYTNSSKVINKNMDFDEQAKLLFERLNLEYGGKSSGGSYWNPIGRYSMIVTIHTCDTYSSSIAVTIIVMYVQTQHKYTYTTLAVFLHA